MKRYAEYDRETGKIISILNASQEITTLKNDPTGLIEVPVGFQCDTSAYVVRDGEIVRAYETGDERRERERAEKEQKQIGVSVMNTLAREYFLAFMFGDNKAMERIRQEAEPLRKYYE